MTGVVLPVYGRNCQLTGASTALDMVAAAVSWEKQTARIEFDARRCSVDVSHQRCRRHAA